MFWGKPVGRMSADKRPTVGRQSADRRPTVGRQTADSRPTDGRQSADRFFGELFFTITGTSAQQCVCCAWHYKELSLERRLCIRYTNVQQTFSTFKNSSFPLETLLNTCSDIRLQVAPESMMTLTGSFSIIRGKVFDSPSEALKT